MKKLGAYLEREKISASAFGALVQVSGWTITRYIDGTRTPRLSVLQRISEATGGEVQPTDFFPAREQEAAD